MFHAHAWGVPYLATLLGVKQIYPGRYEPGKLLDLFQKESVTFSHCVPTILHMVLNAPEAEAVDFNGWKMTIGGSALPVALAVQARARGIDLFSGYGMSETGPGPTCSAHRSALLLHSRRIRQTLGRGSARDLSPTYHNR
jgi:fatty-acyl-CoA synthase